MPPEIMYAGDRPGQLRDPLAIVVDGQGNLCVADSGNNRIQMLPAAARP